MRIGEHVFHQPIAAVRFGIGQAIKQAITLRIRNLMIQIAFFFVAKCFAVADQKLEVARVRLIDMRIKNFVYDPVTQREPGPATGVICLPTPSLALEAQRGSIPGAPNATELCDELIP